MIQIGDTIEIIDEALQGKVIKVEKDHCVIKTKEGFEISFPLRQVVKVSDDEITVNYHDSMISISEKEVKRKKKIPQLRAKDKNKVRLEIDLHIHQLTENTKNMTNYDMLTLQVETARKQLEFAIENRIQRVVFIHGVGEGVLRTELEYLFGRYENIFFYDADYSKYGLGATEVYIRQN